MKVTSFTRKALAFRRESRDMKRAGYRRHETDPEIIRFLGRQDEIIVDAVVSCDGKYVYTKLGRAG